MTLVGEASEWFKTADEEIGRAGAMLDSEIPPLWLGRDKPGKDLPGSCRFRLPAVLRARLKSDGLPLVVQAVAPGSAVRIEVTDGDGAVLASETLPSGLTTTLFLPRRAARLRVIPEGAGDPGAADIPQGEIRLGYFPMQKVALKLHAFANGTFPAASARARWKAAGAAARSLRGALHALVTASPAARAGESAHYRAFRRRYVGDFRTGAFSAHTARLSFLSAAREVPTADLIACNAALAAQTDSGFEWVIALSPARMAAEGQELAKTLGPAVRLVEAKGADLASGLKAALSAAREVLWCPLDPAGRPTEDAVAMIRDAIELQYDSVILYTDEERCDGTGAALAGVFKPAYNRHLFEASAYMGHLMVMPTITSCLMGLDESAGEACVFDLALRLAAKAAPGTIRHIPRVAYSAPAGQAPGFRPEMLEDAARVLARHRGVPVTPLPGGRHLRVHYAVPEPAPLVSIVVPTRDRAGLLGMALRSLIAKTDYRAFEIVIVDNGSVEPETFALFDESKALWPATTVVRDDGDFNFPRICNAGVSASRGGMILLLNNDIEVVDGAWLTEMVALASLPQTGVVGAKLLFPDRTVQHGGVIVGLFRYADHWFAHSAADAPGYEDRLLVRQNLSAVTGACLLIRRTVWDEIGPLDAVRFAEDCNDVDLCLRARAAGYDVVFTPHAELIHHESASRGKKRSKAHRARLKAQRARMEGIWHTSRFIDPHYNPNLARKSLYAALAQKPLGPRSQRSDSVTAAMAPEGAEGR